MKDKSTLWENDASLVPMTPSRKAMIDNTAHRNMRRHGVKPEDLPNPKYRKEYEEWIKANPEEKS